MIGSLEQLLDSFYYRIKLACDKFLTRTYWQLELSLFCVLLMFFLCPPSFENLSTVSNRTWEVVLKQIDNHTIQYAVENPNSHESKRTFRLTVPLLCKLIGLRDIRLIYTLQVFFTVFFFWLLARFSQRLSRDSMVAVLLPISFCFTAIGQVGVFDVYAKFDSFALFFLLAAIAFENPAIILFSIILGGFTDERAFIASPMVLIWWQMQSERDFNIPVKKVIKLNARSFAVLFGMIGYLLLRLYLIKRYDLVTVFGDIGFSIMQGQQNMYYFGTWTAFEGFWLVVLLAMVLLYCHGCYVLLTLLLVVGIPSLLVAHFVIDITRSMIYAMPLVFISLKIISRQSASLFFGRLMILIVLINLLVSTYWAFGNSTIVTHFSFLHKLFGKFF